MDPAFPQVDRAPGSPAPALTVRSNEESTTSKRSIAGWLALVVAAAGAGGAAGYLLKPPAIDETRFVNFDAVSPPPAPSTGWSGFEVEKDGETFDWCAATTCSMRIENQADGDRIVRVRLTPFRFPDAPPQTLTLFVNDTMLGTKPLDDHMSTVSFRAARSYFRKGGNDLRFEFAYAEDPKSKFPGAGDPRKLSAAFDWVEIALPPK